jgi:uncharacterized membrane protein
MAVIYTVAYLFFGVLGVEMGQLMLKDWNDRLAKEPLGMLKTWAPVILGVTGFGAYVFWCLYHLSTMDWSCINR